MWDTQHHLCSYCGQITLGSSHCSMPAAVARASHHPSIRHTSGSNLNPNAWGLLEPSPGGRVTAGDTTLLMVRGRGVTTSHHCTQNPHECRKSTVTNPITMKKKFVSRDKSVSTFHQNNTASVGFAPGPSPTTCILRWHKVSHPRP